MHQDHEPAPPGAFSAPAPTAHTQVKETQQLRNNDNNAGVNRTAHGDGSGGGGNDVEDKDVALLMVGETKHEIDPVVAARAVRKTDLFLIPAMTFGCELLLFSFHGLVFLKS